MSLQDTLDSGGFVIVLRSSFYRAARKGAPGQTSTRNSPTCYVNDFGVIHAPPIPFNMNVSNPTPSSSKVRVLPKVPLA